MSETNTQETWQVEVNGEIYEADFAELTVWIAEGSLQPEDKVRRGNLRWIEARKVPPLVAFFNAKTSGTPPPPVVVTTTVVPEPPMPVNIVKPSQQAIQGPARETVPESKTPGADTESAAASLPSKLVPNDPNVCANHIDRLATNLCTQCSLSLCRDCVRLFGSSVKVCANCGGMCKPKNQVEAEQRKTEFQSTAISQGFGFGDFGQAIAYPFKFKTSLFFGALLFMFFSIGKSASGMGGIQMIAAAIIAYMLANMLTFGILANTVESFAHGKIGGNFMPSFDDFSLWDEVVHPFFLSIGAYISSFGPFGAVLLIGSYMVVSAVSSQADTMNTQLANTPGTPYYTGRDTIDQSNQVKSMLANSNRINQQKLDREQDLESGNEPPPLPTTTNSEEDNFQHVNNMIAEGKKKELEAVVGKSAETREKESQQFISGLLRLAAPLVVLGFLTFLWGAFYFPAACTVAGYTRSFMATINPLVGLDTIKRLGFDYVKILFMGFVLVITSVAFSAILAYIFSPFDMPGMGNLPAKAIGSIFEFYIWIVFPCILGFALFKASDRIQLYS
jgi:hypothetical protein